MAWQRERGNGRIGFIFALAIFCAVVFTAIKIVPVRINAYNFREVLRTEARMGAVRNSDETIAKRIMEHAEDLEIPLSKKNLKVRRTKSRMIVEASYEQPIDLKVMTYVYRFQTKQEAPLF